MISLVIVSCILIILKCIIIHDNAFILTFYIGLATGSDFLTIVLERFVELSVFQNNSSLVS